MGWSHRLNHFSRAMVFPAPPASRVTIAKSDDKSSYAVCGKAAKAWRTTEQLVRAKVRAGEKAAK